MSATRTETLMRRCINLDPDGNIVWDDGTFVPGFVLRYRNPDDDPEMPWFMDFLGGVEFPLDAATRGWVFSAVVEAVEAKGWGWSVFTSHEGGTAFMARIEIEDRPPYYGNGDSYLDALLHAYTATLLTLQNKAVVAM